MKKIAKKQPRAFGEIVALVKSGTERAEVIEAAKGMNYTEKTANIMFFKAQQQVNAQRVKRIFRGRVPSKETFIARATADVGMRPTSAAKLYDEYVAEKSAK